MTTPTPKPLGFCKRAWIFVGERFPLSSHIPMIASFSAGNIFMAQTLAQGSLLSSWSRLAVAFGVAMSFFLRLRIFDEIKDYETDLKINPTRPLARGLISLREAKFWLLGLFAFEIFLLLWVSPVLVASHALAMLYSLVMYREFFVGSLIRPHLTTYAVLHTFVSVLVGASVASIMTGIPFWNFSYLFWMLLLANWGFFNLFEFARKTFAPAEERENVESYSKIFGVPGSVLLSLSQALVPPGILYFVLGAQLDTEDRLILGALLGLVLIPALFFALRPSPFSAKAFRGLVGVYLILGYLGVAWVLAF